MSGLNCKRRSVEKWRSEVLRGGVRERMEEIHSDLSAVVVILNPTGLEYTSEKLLCLRALIREIAEDISAIKKALEDPETWVTDVSVDSYSAADDWTPCSVAWVAEIGNSKLEVVYREVQP